LENSLLGVRQFAWSRSTMTCVTYNRSGYGTVTSFQVDHVDSGDDDTWVRSIRPVAALPRVPRQVLKKLLKSVPARSGRTSVKIKTRAISPGSRLRWRGADPMPKIRYRDHISGAVLSSNLAESLAVDMHWLPLSYGPSRNLVDATIPQMITWMHANASLLRNINVSGTAYLHRQSNESSVVRWRYGPGNFDHEGQNPHIVTLFPSTATWATARLYWTGERR